MNIQQQVLINDNNNYKTQYEILLYNKNNTCDQSIQINIHDNVHSIGINTDNSIDK